MSSPYRSKLDELLGHKVTIDRDGAPSLEGKVADVEETGCTIARKGSIIESSNFTFIAYADIRGVSYEGWDESKITK